MRIAIVNDMAMAVEAIQRVLAGTQRHQIAWVAHDGAEALRRCSQDRPDLILMDLVMPVMDGVEATRQIMATAPCAILIVTANRDTLPARIFEAMGAGALDVVNTPIATVKEPDGGSLLAKVDVISKLVSTWKETSPPKWNRPDSALPGLRRCPLIAIGASAGGPAALATLLAVLPEDFPASFVIIQHIDEQFAAGLAQWLNEQTALSVRLAQEGDRLTSGTVLVAGRADHLALVSQSTLGYTAHPRDYAYRPSVDVFFESLAKNWQGDAVGVLLTGMGRDGALGLKSLRNKGYLTIAQDQATCTVYGMPKAAVALEAAAEILPLGEIALRLQKITNDKVSSAT